MSLACYPHCARLVLAMLVGCMPINISRSLVADDAETPPALEEVWRVGLIEGQPTRMSQFVRRAVLRDGMVIITTRETTIFPVAKFNRPATGTYTYYSEESVTGEPLFFAEKWEMPGEATIVNSAEVRGDQLHCSTVLGEQTRESSVDWTPELAAGMRWQAHFQDYAWHEGDTMTAVIYDLEAGVMTAKYTALGESDVTLIDGSTRTLMHVQQVNEIDGELADTVDYFLAPEEGIVVEHRGGLTIESVADRATLESLLAASATAIADAPAEPEGELIEEYWEIGEQAGDRMGRGHTTVRRVERDSAEVIIEQLTFQQMTTRVGEERIRTFRITSEYTPEGELLRMSEIIWIPGEPETSIEGVVNGDVLNISLKVDGEITLEDAIDWTEELIDGMRFAAGIESYAWQADEEVSTSEFDFRRGVLTVTYTNLGEVEMTLYDESAVTLLHIRRVQTDVAGGTQTSHHYLDTSGGGTIIRDDEAAGVVIERVPRSVAEDVNVRFHEVMIIPDVAFASGVAPADILNAQSVVYHLTLPELTADAVSSDRRQSVAQVDADTIEVRISAGSVSGDRCSDEEREICLASGDYIDLDDPALRALAEEGVGDADTPLEQALALESFVGTLVNDSQDRAYDTASQIAQHREGDCSEHAVLLVALLRINGIPARGADGAIINDLQQNAIGHMWVEAYIDGKWLSLDATRAVGGITPAYIKLMDWDLVGDVGTAVDQRLEGIWHSDLVIEVREVEVDN